MLARVAILSLAGCGRIGFAPEPQDARDVGPQGPANVAFLTSSLHAGDFGGQAGADAICAARAAEAGLPGTFVSWMSTAQASAFERIAGARGWRDVDGSPIADLPADFVSARLLGPLVEDEHGNDVRLATPGFFWSGTDQTGRITTDACQAWMSASAADTGNVGTIGIGGIAAISATTRPCDLPARLLCLQTDLVAEVQVAPEAGRLAFISSATWVPNPAGLGDADRVCNEEGRAVRRTATFRAALGTATTATASRFDLGKSAWVRADGARLSATAGELFTTALIATSLDQAADGVVITDPFVWGGDPNATPRNDTCSDWTSRADAFATLGSPHSSVTAAFFQVVNSSCIESGRHLLCLEQ